MNRERQIIHCDNCGCICMVWQNFCSWCRRERITFAWQPVPLNSPAYWQREEMRGDKQKDYDLYLGNCEKCGSLFSIESDRFCGFCGEEVKA